MTDSLTASPKRRGRLWRRAALVGATLTAALVPSTSANADYFYSRSEAQRLTKYWASNHYTNTYTWNLTTACRPQSRPYDPAYEYHRWVCYWEDDSDDTVGKVLIIGSRGSGDYYYKVLRGAQ